MNFSVHTTDEENGSGGKNALEYELLDTVFLKQCNILTLKRVLPRQTRRHSTKKLTVRNRISKPGTSLPVAHPWIRNHWDFKKYHQNP